MVLAGVSNAFPSETSLGSCSSRGEVYNGNYLSDFFEIGL